MKRLDLICAVAMLTLSAIVFLATRDLPIWSDFAPGSAFLPLWVAASGALLGLIMLMAAVRRKTDKPVDWPDRGGIMRVLQTAAALWIFVAVMPFLGTAVSAALFMLVMLLGVQRRPLVPSLVATAVTVGLVEGIFVFWLEVRLPKGVFGF